MASIEQQLSERFFRWERRTRGSLVYPHPVPPEPPFVSFPAAFRPTRELADDGRRPTALSSWLKSFWAAPGSPEPEEDEAPPEAQEIKRGAITELPLSLPPSFDAKDQIGEGFLRSLFVCQQPIAFELIGTPEAVTAQFAASAEDAGHLRQQLHAHFPELSAVPTAGRLETAWQAAGTDAGVIEFGLAKESVCLLADTAQDPFVGLVGVLGELAADECAVFQVLWQHVENPWAEDLVRSVTDATGKAFFVNAPELADGARKKISRPLYAAVVRLAACSGGFDRTWELLRRLASGLRVFANPHGNELVPLRNDDYPFDAHLDDLLLRQSRRAGMILNADELLGFVHPPSSAVRSPRFQRRVKTTKAAPSFATAATGLRLGVNEHAGETREVRLTAEQRVRHVHVVGASGTGKSTLLFNLIRQDIENGAGVGVFDPHGDLIDQLLGVIPAHRVADTVLIDPSDEAFSVGFNILSAHSDWEKNLLASDLVSVFRRLSTSWGDQMDRVLANAILAFLESERGGTLLELRRFLVESAFREKFLATVRDPEVVYYWRKGFAQLSGNKSVGPVLTRLETFLAPKPIRCMVAQRANRIDFGDILDTGKIFLAKLSQGALGKENAHLLGSLFVAKFQQLAMSRQRQAADTRRDFWLYLDEFQDFMTPSLAEMLAGTRKYRVGLTLAHQEMRQVQRDADVAGAVANAGTQIYFRVGDQDARALAQGLASFDARDLQNLGVGEAICRVERSDGDFNLTVSLPERPDESEASVRRSQVVSASRARYATPRADVEAVLREQIETETAAEARVTKSAPKPQAPKVEPPTSTGAVSPVSAPPPATPVNQTQPAPAVVSQPAGTKRTPADPSEWGRGGKQHSAVSRRIKDAAEKVGFRVAIDASVPGMAGGVDLILSRADLAIACEVTVTNLIDYEVGNVEKCAKAGFAQIAVVGVVAEKLQRMETAVRHSLGAEVAARVRYFLPDEFIAHVQALPPPAPPSAGVRESRGYRIKRSYPQLSPEEAKAREDATIDALADLMKRKTKR